MNYPWANSAYFEINGCLPCCTSCCYATYDGSGPGNTTNFTAEVVDDEISIYGSNIWDNPVPGINFNFSIFILIPAGCTITFAYSLTAGALNFFGETLLLDKDGNQITPDSDSEPNYDYQTSGEVVFTAPTYGCYELNVHLEANGSEEYPITSFEVSGTVSAAGGTLGCSEINVLEPSGGGLPGGGP